MPEGDTVHFAANRIRPILAGRVPALATPHPRYGRAGRPCPRCGAPIRQRGQWDDNRAAYGSPGCQR